MSSKFILSPKLGTGLGADRRQEGRGLVTGNPAELAGVCSRCAVLTLARCVQQVTIFAPLFFTHRCQPFFPEKGKIQTVQKWTQTSFNIFTDTAYLIRNLNRAFKVNTCRELSPTNVPLPPCSA